MRVLITSIGSLGDLLPLLGLGKALRERGHSVAMITVGSFEADVRAAGLDYIEICDAATYQDVLANLEQVAGEKKQDKEALARVTSVMETVPERLYDLIAEHHVPGDTVSVSLPWYTFGATKAAEDALGVPNVYAWINIREFRLVQPMLPAGLRGIEDGTKNLLLRLFLRQAKRRLDALRAKAQLPPERNMAHAWLYSQRLNICLFPDWLAPWYRGRLPNAVFTGFPLYRREQSGDLPAELEAFISNGTPPIVFANASWRSDLEEYFRASVSTCQALGRRGVLLSPKAPQFDGLTEDVIGVDYADFVTLLPRAAAVVHHAGLGSVAAALAAGCPQIGVPWVNDQFFNANAVKDMDAGLTIRHQDYQRDIMPTLQKLLASAEIKDACVRIARRLEGGPVYAEAMQRLESVLDEARRQRPVLKP